MKTILRTMVLIGVVASLALSQATWTVQTSGVTATLRCVKVLSPNIALVSGASGTLLRTVDGGATWVKLTPPNATFTYYCIEAFDTTTIWLGGTGSSGTDFRIWKTTDAGKTWTQQFQSLESYSDGLRFFDSNNGVGLGDPGASASSKFVVTRTTDGGANWTIVQNVPPADSVNAETSTPTALDIYGNNAWFVTYGNSSAIVNPRVYKSTDRGATWTASSRITGLQEGFCLSFKDDKSGVIGNVFEGKGAITSDGGATWKVVKMDTVYGMRAIQWIRPTNAIMVVGGLSSKGIAMKSVDGGNTWTHVDPPSGVVRLRHLNFLNSSTGWAVGDGGGIVKWTGGDLAPAVAPKIYMNDDFTAPAGTALTSAGWIQSATSAVNPLTIASPSLTFTGLPGSGVGGAVPMTNNGQDVYKSFPPVNSGNVYLSFLMNISAVLTGDYFIAVSPSASQVNYYARLHVQSSGAGYNIGIKKSNETGAQYGTTVYNLNTTYFVTLKYAFNGVPADSATSTDDAISVYVLPSGSSLAIEPATPEINGYVFSGKTDAADLASVTLRQGSATNAPTMIIDDVRVGNSWASATAAYVPDSVYVTFSANTAAVPDTLKPTSFVQIRGGANLFGPWSSGSKAILANVAGDYWKGTYKLKVGDTIQYKFFTNASNPPVVDNGWEQNSTDGSGNRIMAVGPRDTTLPLQFVNGTPDAQPQYFTPYVNQKDSVEVYFRVNMSGLESFNKATQFVGVRGGAAPLDWGKNLLLTRETQHGNGGSRQYDGTNFWSGYARFPKSAFANDIEYKFVYLGTNSTTADPAGWEGPSAAPDVNGGGNRVILKSPGISDTTLYWKWWSNNPFVPFQGKDTVVVTFRANLARAVAERGFSFGDTVQVRSGYGGTAMAVRTKALTRSGLTGTIFIATDTIVSAVGKAVNYQYYMVKNGVDIKEDFFDFNDVAGSTQAERRKLNLTSKSLSVFDTAVATSDMRRMPRFRNTSPLSKNVLVTYTVDVRPAYYTVKAGKKLVATNITPYVIGNADSVMKWGVWMNGPAVGGWDTRGGWGPARRADSTSKMFDDGTHGDVVKGDSIYSLTWQYTKSDFLGQEFKFGIGGFDNEGGFGNNHIENIDDAAATFTIACQFGSIDPKFFNSWDYDLKKPKLATDVEAPLAIPLAYNLSQNYPNPFNPSTTIRFDLPNEEIVTLKIFNSLGQVMMTLLNEKMGAGNHTVRFDASKLTSGVYFYQINAGKFIETKKMMLVK